MYLQFAIIYITFGLFTLAACDNGDYTLELIQAVFRHGSRTPQRNELYANNNNAINNFHPYGYGQLTKNGKLEAYTLGKLLYEKYGKFLEANRTTDTVFAYATNFDRTKMTILLVLAALFPPTPSETWSDDLNWLPIPYHSDKLKHDFTLWKPMNCPAYYNELQRLHNSSVVQQFVENNLEIIQHIENHSGQNTSHLRNLFRVHQGLDGEAHMNLTLPDWAKEIYPDQIKRLVVELLSFDYHTPLLKRLYSGRALKIITNNMLQKAQGTLEPKNRKIFLYAGHDNNIIGLLMTLDIFKQKFPKYCSGIIFELLRSKITKEYFVKVYHVSDLKIGAEEKKLPGCDLLCPINNFFQILEPFFPINYTQECESDILLE